MRKQVICATEKCKNYVGEVIAIFFYCVVNSAYNIDAKTILYGAKMFWMF